ncbi:hypothetical protein FNV43_RR22146 [Rhamnella rubrinervis]|uniref:Uncharacterized protein n=1 Tax=Rhamnella rubrinervis TaxID=2594499 RepID=A0A8K0DVL2_9ROSA|nr:hypothetical protein FNV43_RR22146 [Rhamnella rubrinervis]
MASSKCMILMAFLVAFSVFSSNFCVSGTHLVRVEVHPSGSPPGITIPYYIDLDHECPLVRAGKKTSINLGGVDFDLRGLCPPALAPAPIQAQDEVEVGVAGPYPYPYPGPDSGPAEAPYADEVSDLVADADPET